MNKIIPLCSALLLILAVCAPRVALAQGDNLLEDASFEDQLPPGEGWILFDGSRISMDRARTGKRSVYNWGFSRPVPSPPFLLGSASGSYQEFPAVPGSRWRLTGYGMTPTPLEGAPAFGIVQLSFFDAAGNDLGTLETVDDKNARAKTSNQVNGRSPAGEWILLDTGVATAPASAVKVHAFSLYVDYSGSETTQGVYFDDLKLCSLGAGDSGPDCK